MAKSRAGWGPICLLSLLPLAGCGGSDFGGSGGGGGSPDLRFSAVTASNRLVTFEPDTPGTILNDNAITGLQAGETIVGIDFRPADGLLYGLGSTGRLYRIDSGGIATQVGTGITALSGTDFAVDFNPAVDRLRVIGNGGQNVRINPADGTTAGSDTALNPGVPAVVAAAYDRNFSTGGAGTTTSAVTTLFAIDAGTDQLVRQGGVDGTPSPNGGTLATVGALGVNTTNSAGLDINGSTGEAFAALQVAPATNSALYRVDLATGTATLVGNIGGAVIHDIAIPVPPVADAFVTTASGNLFRFSLHAPQTQLDSDAISGLTAGDTIKGIDFRPATEDLVALGSGAAPAGSARLYRINASTGAATLLNVLAADPADASSPYTGLSGTFFGVDFNPVPDRLRVVSDNGQNLRINVDTGLVTTDTALTGVSGATVVGSGYNNNFQGAATTQLFAVDTSTNPDRLLLQDPPNNGTLAVIGTNLGAGINSADNQVGFDVAGGGRGLAFAAINVGAESHLYRINTTDGTATRVPTGTSVISAGASPVTGFTVRVREP